MSNQNVGYKLSLKAQEIEEKLKKIKFDNELKEGSENLVTSGVIYEAFQNTKNENVNLTAENLIEIKNGVIRSTIGDKTGETVEIYKEIYRDSDIRIIGDSVEDDNGDCWYVSEYASINIFEKDFPKIN